MLKHIFIIVSPSLEPKRYEYLTQYLQNHNLDAPITFWEPLYKGRDEHLFNYEKYINLKPGEIGLAQTYENLFEYIVQKFHKNELFLILESDVIFTNNFTEKINIILTEFKHLNNETSVVFLGDGCNMHPKSEQQKTEHLYQTNYTKCTDSMIFTYSCIEKFFQYTKKNIVYKPVDHLWNDIIKIENIFSYWIEPPIINQGSQLGIYPSTIR